MSWNPHRVYDVIRQCGELALSIQHSAERSIKSDHTIVTEADTRIEELVISALAEDGNVFHIGEETSKTSNADYHSRALRGKCFVTDPVDGTVLYSNHLPGWGISIGYMEGGRLAEGAILFPSRGELLISDGDSVFRAQSYGACCPRFEDLEPMRPPSPRPSSPVISLSQTIIKYGQYNGSYSCLSTGSCVSGMLYLATGGIIAYLTRTRLWDLAAGYPIIKKLGLQAFNTDGSDFPLDILPGHWHLPPTSDKLHWRMKDHVVFCATREVFDAVMERTTIP